MHILVINGPNLNLLGMREQEIYGHLSYSDLETHIQAVADALDLEVTIFQSNHEGAIVDKIQQAYGKMDGILINAAAYSHTSIAILDALMAVKLPTAEVHLSNIEVREPFRHFSYVSLYAQKVITGKGFMGYKEGLKWLQTYIENEREKEEY